MRLHLSRNFISFTKRALATAFVAGPTGLGAGACGEVTVAPGGSSTTGAGDPSSHCPAGEADCRGDGHCEALTSVDACGGCGVVCSENHASASCAKGQCVLVCDTGHADCDGDPSNGCEAALDADPLHCGACERACGQETDCFERTCVSIVATAPAALVGAESLLVWGSDLYWASPGVNAVGEVVSVPLEGGAVVPRATSLGWPDRLRSNGAWLVWSDVTKPGIYRMALPEGPVETVYAPGPGEAPRVLDLAQNRVYFTTGADVRVVDVAGGAPSLVATFGDVSAGRVHGDALYVVDLGPEIPQAFGDVVVAGHPEGSLSRVALDSGALTTLAAHLDSPVALAFDDSAVYWAEAGSMATYDVGSKTENAGSLGRVRRVSFDGQAALTLADQQVRPVDVTVDGGYVYFASEGTVGGLDPSTISYEADGRVARVPSTGGPLETVMPAIDARNVLVANGDVFFASWNLGLVFRKKTSP